MDFFATALLFGNVSEQSRIQDSVQRARLADFVQAGMLLDPDIMSIAARMFLPMMQRMNRTAATRVLQHPFSYPQRLPEMPNDMCSF
jgi:hypothetical protein